jgi:hypothetical protein
MKNLKFLYITLLTLAVVACEEDLKFPDKGTGIVPTVQVNADKQAFNVGDLANTAVEFTLGYDNFGGKLAADTIFINVASGAAIDAALTFATSKRVKYITEFPSTVTLSLAEICTALGLNINTVTNNRSFEIFFVVKTEDGTVYRDGLNLHTGVVSSISLGYYRYRFFAGCVSPIEEGYYTSTLSGANPKGLQLQKEVKISRQRLDVETNNHLNFLRDIFSITDLTAGYYPQSGLAGNWISNQPMGIRDACGTLGVYLPALLTLPSPNPQIASLIPTAPSTVTITIQSGSYNPATKTLTITWKETQNNITETTTFVKVRDL